jgi:hypothetical protein
MFNKKTKTINIYRKLNLNSGLSLFETLDDSFGRNHENMILSVIIYANVTRDGQTRKGFGNFRMQAINGQNN